MKHLLFSIYDSKAETFYKPIPDISVGSMLRNFQELSNDKNTVVGKHPEDFTLFQIGEWDDDKGEVIMLESKVSLGMAIQYVDSKPSFNEEINKGVKDERLFIQDGQ